MRVSAADRWFNAVWPTTRASPAMGKNVQGQGSPPLAGDGDSDEDRGMGWETCQRFVCVCASGCHAPACVGQKRAKGRASCRSRACGPAGVDEKSASAEVRVRARTRVRPPLLMKKVRPPRCASAEVRVRARARKRAGPPRLTKEVHLPRCASNRPGSPLLMKKVRPPKCAFARAHASLKVGRLKQVRRRSARPRARAGVRARRC